MTEPFDAWRQMNADQYCEAVKEMLWNPNVEFTEAHRGFILQCHCRAVAPSAVAAIIEPRVKIHTFDPNAPINLSWMGSFQVLLQTARARLGGRWWG